MNTENKSSIVKNIENQQSFTPVSAEEIAKQKEASQAISDLEQQAVPSPEALLDQSVLGNPSVAGNKIENNFKPIEELSNPNKILEQKLIHTDANNIADVSKMTKDIMGL